MAQSTCFVVVQGMEKGFEIPLRRSGLILLAMCVEGRKGLQIPSPYFVIFDLNGGLEENRSGEVEDDTGVAQNNFENSISNLSKVPGTGLEPAHLSILDPKSSASTNSAIPAGWGKRIGLRAMGKPAMRGDGDRWQKSAGRRGSR